MLKDPAPIALFVYNRPEHTRKVLESLSENFLAESSVLYIFADGPKIDSGTEALHQIQEVRRVIKSSLPFREVKVFEYSENRGLANSVINGINIVFDTYDRIIVLEDDLRLSPYFLTYMNNALDLYNSHKEVMHISGYWHPVKNTLPETFFLRFATSWGWATWKRSWSAFEPSASKLLCKFTFDKKRVFDFNYTFNFYRMLKKCHNKQNDSWAVRWYATVFLNDGLCLFPNLSYVDNVGHDNSGIHSQATNVFNNKTLNMNPSLVEIAIVENGKARRLLEFFFLIAKIRMTPLLIIEKLKKIKQWF
ncbi:MAG TPA: hypothetical protein VF691_13235 [Cytophagaceae bacterium]|jgi:glycosyltransferase involved in cell wall biosynthesis